MLDLHKSAVAHELRRSDGVTLVASDRKVFLGPYLLTCRFDRPPIEQLPPLPLPLALHKKRLRPGTAPSGYGWSQPLPPAAEFRSPKPPQSPRKALASKPAGLRKPPPDVQGLGQRSLGPRELLAVQRREACLRRLRHTLHTALRVRGTCASIKGLVATQYQKRLSDTLLELLHCSVEVVQAAETWRGSPDSQGAKLLKRGDTLRTVPEAFVWNGANYLLKMLTDMDGLPVPGGSDPFLLRWFGRDSHWWQMPGCMAMDLLNPELRCAEHEVNAMRSAEKVLHNEALAYDFELNDAMSGARRDLGQAMELLLYGRLGHYEKSVSRIREEARRQASEEAAARLLQRLTRGRNGRKQTHLKRDAALAFASSLGAATSIQAAFRGKQFREQNNVGGRGSVAVQEGAS